MEQKMWTELRQSHCFSPGFLGGEGFLRQMMLHIVCEHRAQAVASLWLRNENKWPRNAAAATDGLAAASSVPF